MVTVYKSRLDRYVERVCLIFDANSETISKEKRNEIEDFLMDVNWKAWEMLCQMCSQEEECKKPTEQINAENT